MWKGIHDHIITLVIQFVYCGGSLNSVYSGYFVGNEKGTYVNVAVKKGTCTGE